VRLSSLIVITHGRAECSVACLFMTEEESVLIDSYSNGNSDFMYCA